MLYWLLAPLKSVKPLDEGWDNKVYLVNDHIIFRFPRRKIAIQLIERENVLLPALQQHLPLSIPQPIYLGKPSADFPHAYHGYECVPGQSGHEARLSNDERNASITRLAHFLKALHNIDAIQASTMGAKPQVFDRTDIPNITTACLERANRIVQLNQSIIQDEINAIKNIKLSQTHKTLVHGDLYCKHMLFDQGQLTGIIDWGDVGINNPVVDLMAVFCFYPSQVHDDFLKIYGEVAPQSWAYAKFLGLYSAVAIILYGQDVEDSLLVAEGFATLQRINPALLI